MTDLENVPTPTPTPAAAQTPPVVPVEKPHEAAPSGGTTPPATQMENPREAALYGEMKEERRKRQQERERRVAAEKRAEEQEARIRDLEARQPKPTDPISDLARDYPDDPATRALGGVHSEVQSLRKTVEELRAEQQAREDAAGSEWYSDFSDSMKSKYGHTGAFDSKDGESSAFNEFMREAMTVVNFNTTGEKVDEQIEALFRHKHMESILAKERQEAIAKHEEAKRTALGPSPTPNGSPVPAIGPSPDFTKRVLEKLARQGI